MRDILIVSDTHGRVSRLNELIEYRQSLDKSGDPLTLIYLGDGLTDLFSCSQYDNIICHAVRGNCDFSSEIYGNITNKTEAIELMGHRIVLTHGDLYNVKLGLALVEKLAEDTGADILLFGHTHLKLQKYVNVDEKYADAPAYKEKLKTLKSYYLFNPGSAKGYDRSYGILTITDTAILISHGN